MKQIRITESQLSLLKKAIKEQNEVVIDATPNPTTGKVDMSTLSKEYQTAKQSAPSADVALKVDGSDLTEGEEMETECNVYTKKQIKEAKLRKLKENCTTYKKGEF